MTAYPKHAFDVAPGSPQPTLRELIFRRLRWWRKPAAPGTSLLSGAAPAGDAVPRFPCCEHCVSGGVTLCALPGDHRVACSVGCNARAGGTADQAAASLLADIERASAARPARNDVTAPSGLPVLRDRMLSEVRAEYEPAAPAPWRPSSAMDTGEFAALDAKVDAAMSARYLPVAPELAGGFRRPVNGRNLGTRPRTYGQAPQLEVERDAYLAEEAAEAARAEYVRSQMREGMAARDPQTLRQVLTGLRKL